MLSSVFFAWLTALPAILLDSWTCRPISLTDEVISSVAAATAWIFSVTVFEADEAEPDSDIVTSDVFVKVVADVANSVEAAELATRSEEHTSELQSHVNLVC